MKDLIMFILILYLFYKISDIDKKINKESFDAATDAAITTAVKKYIWLM